METWTTKDGRELKISEMETDHINRTIGLLRKSTNPMADKYVKVFCAELDRRKTLLPEIGKTYESRAGFKNEKIKILVEKIENNQIFVKGRIQPIPFIYLFLG